MRALPASLLLACGAPASAQNAQVFLGAELVLRFSPAVEPGLGIEATSTVLPQPIGPELGVYGDVRALLRSGIELSVGGHGGLGVKSYGDGTGYWPTAGANVEAGPVWGTRWGHGLRIGGELRGDVGEVGASVVHLFRPDVGSAWTLSTASAGVQAPLLSAWVTGRPLRVGAGWVLPAWRAAPGTVLGRAARAWLEQAREELASVGTFLRLAAELRLHDAPEGLVRRALRAARDERRHARVCLRQACRHAGGPLWLGGLPPLAPRAVPLQVLADEALVDGVHGEGEAAATAHALARRSTDPHEAQVHAVIAQEESEHAALGLDLVKWCASRGALARGAGPPAGWPRRQG